MTGGVDASCPTSISAGEANPSRHPSACGSVDRRGVLATRSPAGDDRGVSRLAISHTGSLDLRVHSHPTQRGYRSPCSRRRWLCAHPDTHRQNRISVCSVVCFGVSSVCHTPRDRLVCAKHGYSTGVFSYAVCVLNGPSRLEIFVIEFSKLDCRIITQRLGNFKNYPTVQAFVWHMYFWAILTS